MTTSERDLGEELRRLVSSGALALADPGRGATAARHRALFDLGRRDVALARLAEAHTDAVAILHEAGREAEPGATYGVWAAEDPGARLELTEGARGRALVGTKAFATGAGLVDRALVTVPTAPGVVLVDVAVGAGAPLRVDLGGWVTPAFAETHTALVHFDELAVADGDQVGGPGWYLDRPGFWHGACGPAACWAGGAAGLVDALARALVGRRPDPHRDAHLGAAEALRWRMGAVLEVAGHEIDADPGGSQAAHRRALAVRHTIERDCVEIVDRLGRALGPRPRAFDAATSRRLAEVELYVRQCHAERDLEALGMSWRTETVRRTG